MGSIPVSRLRGPGRLTSLPHVYPILDIGSMLRVGADPMMVAEGFLEGGASILQLRNKGFWSRDMFALAERLAAIVPLVINDRADFAALLGCGLHVGQDDLAPSLVRPLIGDSLLGFSTHNAEQMRLANGEDIDYVAFGPVFGTSSKERPDPTTGIEALRAVRALTRLPLVAIGGITGENASICREAGADSVAVISELLPADCTKHAIRERMAEWQQLS